MRHPGVEPGPPANYGVTFCMEGGNPTAGPMTLGKPFTFLDGNLFF